MMYFLDESLVCLIQEYEDQIAKYENMRTLNNTNKTINTLENNTLQALENITTNQAA